MCEHLALLDKLYPGCYCPYCGYRIANIEADEYGQIYLQRADAEERRYVAVIHRDQQRAVGGISLSQGQASIIFQGDAEAIRVDVTSLLSAFQGEGHEQEVLRIK